MLIDFINKNQERIKGIGALLLIFSTAILHKFYKLFFFLYPIKAIIILIVISLVITVSIQTLLIKRITYRISIPLYIVILCYVSLLNGLFIKSSSYYNIEVYATHDMFSEIDDEIIHLSYYDKKLYLNPGFGDCILFLKNKVKGQDYIVWEYKTPYHCSLVKIVKPSLRNIPKKNRNSIIILEFKLFFCSFIVFKFTCKFSKNHQTINSRTY